MGRWKEYGVTAVKVCHLDNETQEAWNGRQNEK